MPDARPTFDLADAVARAEPGAVVEVPAGRHLLPRLALAGKALTLQAAPGARPVLVRSGHARAWDALVASDRDLTLAGLELHGGAADGPPVPLVAVEGARLTLRDCTLVQRGPAPAVSLRQGPQLTLERCRVTALAQALAVEAPAGRECRAAVRGGEVRVKDATGAALLVWAREASPPAAVEVEVAGAAVRAGRVLACRALAGPVRLQATDSRLAFHQALVSFDGYRGGDAWRRAFTWHGRHNRYEPGGAWLRLEGRAGPAWDERAFERLWAGRP
jgi:hypothetical protein